MNSFVSWTNTYGGIIGIFGIIITWVVYRRTGTAEKNIKTYLESTEYRKKQHTYLKNLKGLLASIEDDGIYDSPIIGELREILVEINYYEKCIDKKMTKCINDLFVETKDFNDKDENKKMVIRLLHELCGHLKHKNIDIGS